MSTRCSVTDTLHNGRASDLRLFGIGSKTYLRERNSKTIFQLGAAQLFSKTIHI